MNLKYLSYVTLVICIIFYAAGVGSIIEGDNGSIIFKRLFMAVIFTVLGLYFRKKARKA